MTSSCRQDMPIRRALDRTQPDYVHLPAPARGMSLSPARLDLNPGRTNENAG